MDAYLAFNDIAPTTLADVSGHCHVVAGSSRPLWSAIPRVVGPAYSVRCEPRDNLMLHAAIYRAPPGSVIRVATFAR